MTTARALADAVAGDLAGAIAAAHASSVELADTIRSFKAIVDGEYDHLPEQAFYMVGSIEEAVAKGQKMAAETSKAA